jgi:hypothetical protein
MRVDLSMRQAVAPCVIPGTVKDPERGGFHRVVSRVEKLGHGYDANTRWPAGTAGLDRPAVTAEA